jgi:hypothetical protein
VCITEEQHSVVRIFWTKNLMQGIFIKKCSLFTVGSVCHLQKFFLGGKSFANDEEIDTEVRKCPRQQLEDFYAAGFDAVIKR